MRIIIDYTPAVHQSAGIGRHTRGLVEALAPLAGAHQLVLLVFGRPGRSPAYARAEAMPGPSQGDRDSGTGLPAIADDSLGLEIPNGCELRVIPAGRLARRLLTAGWYRLRLPFPATWFSNGGDLYHASDFVLPPVGRARSLLTVHDLSFLTVPECAETRLRAFLSRVVPRSVNKADHVLADSHSTKRDLIQRLNVPADKITVIYPGVEARFRPSQDPASLNAVRVRYGLQDTPFVLGVGTIEPRKNWPALIWAWASLRKTAGIPHKLVVAGRDGWLYEGTYQAAAASGLEDDIVFTGFVPDQDLPALYSAADLFVFPSRYEGFGIPVLEALACGTPVVCANNSSLPEAAGDSALLITADDVEGLSTAMLRLIEDEELRASLRNRGLRHASRFSWSVAAVKLLATYEQVAGQIGVGSAATGGQS